MDLFTLVWAFSALCIQTTPLAHGFSTQISTRASPPSSKHGRHASGGDDDDAPSTTRKPWDVIRFVSQSSKFVGPPSLPLMRKSIKRKIGPGEVIWTPSSPRNFFRFSPLDDVVMGGASSSTVDNDTGTWTGTVTDANNGGFVGIRSTPFQNGLSLDMSGCQGVELRLRKGDGQRFKFIVRDSTDFNGVCWTTEFDARGTIIRIPFSNQIPTIFASTVSGKSFDDENVVGFQITYSKFEYNGKLNQNFRLGKFVLQLLELKSY
ncbi:hypothetical protein ACHAXA_001800 [Cyclostephanos tholiformis]|uniref:NADH:ubiquinone oxidoreductase intermediate-associated protein 30 domain-containing protein n=1 Tax=Cyclostephanos tholiformis TaxID=382380 RepID=A0ABD3SDN2_9STRA